ncbi:MAG: DEAD/DEAH box helicase [Spirochaetales bacterium]|nr:DEAD/DEAH box helicase [Spirochaetales bacterium]
MVERAIRTLREDPGFMSCVAHWQEIPPREGRYAEFPTEVDPRILSALRSKGVDRLFSHQRAAYEAVRGGAHIVVVTPTASGKTLAYNLPVLQTLLEQPEAKAMYLFPTKALSQDQQSELNEILIGGELPVKIFTYDGDTPQSIRISVREEGRVVITNPDMLHTGVLPNHPKWIKFFQSLRFVVIDEIHTYRGVFGSHMTNLIRRLKRVAGFYGSRPQFICCSATIGNPRELAERIVEEQVVLLDDNGAPAGTRHFVFYNPPLVDPVQGIRRGVVKEAQGIATRLLKQRVKTIVFARSRLRTELIASYIRESLRNHFTQDSHLRIASYRGGYLPNERRAIERGLRQGEILGVVSTNALELGIDIGGLDVSILAGFPGSIASTWQQAGRAGRRATVSLSVLVASASPIDQYIIRHPEYFFGKSPESGWVDPDNVFILNDQLKCAAFELPFEEGELMAARYRELLDYLEENGVLRASGGRWFWADRSYPAEKISLRSSAPGNIVIVDTTRGRDEVIGEMDKPSAKMYLYDEAIYIHLGDQYVVRKLDLENQRCYVESTEVNYYTDSIVKTDIKLLEEDARERRSGMEAAIGDILVRTQATKYKKLKFGTHENIGYGEIDLPADEMHTRAVVLLFPPGTEAGAAFAAVGEEQRPVVMQRLGVLLRNIAPVFLLCDSRDIGVADRLKDPTYECPCLYVYDSYPGGTGLSEGFLEATEEILSGALELVTGCACAEGCPSCIGPPAEVTGFNPKQVVLEFLSAWYGAAGARSAGADAAADGHPSVGSDPAVDGPPPGERAR